MKRKTIPLFVVTLTTISAIVHGIFNEETSSFPTVPNSADVWEPSPTFQVNGEKVIGEPSKVGISTIPLVAGEQQGVDWLLWGKQSDLVKGEFELTARAKGAQPETIIENRAVAYPGDIADARVPTLISVPHSGIWKFEAYIDGELYGSVVIEVINKED